MAITTTKTEITPPVQPRKIFLVIAPMVPAPKVVSIVASRVSIDTQAEARLIAFDAEYTGLLYLRYFTILIIAIVNAVKVYAASAIGKVHNQETPTAQTIPDQFLPHFFSRFMFNRISRQEETHRS